MNPFAKKLRQNMTPVEEKMWALLRDRRFKGHKFRRQVCLGPYIVDYLCFKKNLIIELDGGQHNEEKQKQYDEGRSQWLISQGYQILRFWNHDVVSNNFVVLETILKYLEN
jgi:adenine-specific DNA-methyltransferase